MKKYLLLFLVYSLICLNSSYAQLAVNNVPAFSLVQNLLGPDITISNISFSCNTQGAGTFMNGNTTNLPFDEGVLLTTGDAQGAIGPNNTSGYTGNSSGGNSQDIDLANLINTNLSQINDACVFQFDFFATYADTIKLNYVFGSEEYMEFVNSGSNDAFGIFVTGPNPAGGNYYAQNFALLPNTNVPILIDNVNLFSNSAYYIDNETNVSPTDATKIQYDGFTTELEAIFAVVPGAIYHLKIAIADVSDQSFDSGVFLKSGSLTGTSSNNCPSVLNFSDANPSSNTIEQADDIITTNENLNADRTYKAGHYQTIEYIELQQGFQSGLFNFEAINEQCDLND